MSRIFNKLRLRPEFMFKKLRKNEKRYPCPVCGFHLEYPPDDFNICPSCGVEFGYETASRSFYDLRREWINTGAHWASRVDSKPKGWNPWFQLINAGFNYDVPFRPQVQTHQPIGAQGAIVLRGQPIQMVTFS